MGKGRKNCIEETEREREGGRVGEGPRRFRVALNLNSGLLVGNYWHS